MFPPPCFIFQIIGRLVLVMLWGLSVRINSESACIDLKMYCGTFRKAPI